MASQRGKRHLLSCGIVLALTGAWSFAAGADPAGALPDDGLTARERAEIYGDVAAGDSVNRDILIVDTTRPNAYFGMYRANQMTGAGWDLYERTVNWANGFQNPANTMVWLATYNGTLDPQYSAELGPIAVYNRLINNMGFLPGNIHVAHQSTIETANFTGYDIVLYTWVYPRNATNVMNQNIPFVTMSAGQTDEMGIGTGVEAMHEFRDFAYVADNGHYVTQTYPLGQFTLNQGMWIDASVVAGNGRVLVTADQPIFPPEIIHGAAGVSFSDHAFGGYIDPRCDTGTPPLCLPNQIDSLEIVFNVEPFGDAFGGPVTTANFSATQTGGGAPPTVTAVAKTGNTVTVDFDRVFTVGEWTTVQAVVYNSVGDQIANNGNQGPGVDEVDRVDVGILPGDIDQSGSTLPLDNTRFRQMFVGAFHNPKGIDGDYVDINRDGAILPLDVTVWRANFNSWNFQNLPARP